MKKIHTCLLTFVTAIFLICVISGCSGNESNHPAPTLTLTPTSTPQQKSYDTSNYSSSYKSSSKSYGSSSSSKSSNKCLNCGKPIDDDALYCMSCLEKAVSDSSSSSKSSSSKKSSSSYESSSSKGSYGSDGYYNPTHDELEDAVKDAQDYLKRNGY